MYTTLDWIIVCVLGGLGVGLYIRSVQHFRELCEVKEIAKELCDLYEKSRERERKLYVVANEIADDYSDALDRENKNEELLMDCADALMAWHDEKEALEYNGWVNRETWFFTLYQTNEPALYGRAIDSAKEILTNLEYAGELTQNEKIVLGSWFIRDWERYIEEVPECLYDTYWEEQGYLSRVDAEEVGGWAKELAGHR